MAKKILIIEDEEVLLDILREKLEHEGYEVAIARDGEEGLGKLRSESAPDLVLLDIVMPKLDGFTVLRTIKAEDKLKNVPVIIISNSGQEVEIERAREIGITDYLVKADFSPDEVMDKVRDALGVEKQQSTKTEQSSPKDALAEILFVEDDQFLQRVMTQKLENENMAVLPASNGEEALETLREKRPDLVLLDLLLPGIGGFEVLEQMKQMDRVKDVPVLILSNLGQKEDVDRGMKLGASDYLVKAHFTPSEVIVKIKDILNI